MMLQRKEREELDADLAAAQRPAKLQRLDTGAVPLPLFDLTRQACGLCLWHGGLTIT